MGKTDTSLVDYHITSLEHESLQAIYECFVASFADYSVKISMSFEKLSKMLQRRGFNAKLSYGAYYNDTLIGFILNGVREWDGKKTAYDCGTGIIKEHRGKGLSKKIFEACEQTLKENSVKQYLLEVIQTNTPALNLYKNQGFKIIRDFLCYKLPKNSFVVPQKYNSSDYTFSQTTIDQANQNAELFTIPCDMKPSWQNSIDSIKKASYLYYSICYYKKTKAGFMVYDKTSGDIAYLNVLPEFRKKGIGTYLVDQALKNIDADAAVILNVDAACKDIVSFFANLKCDLYVSQYEMLKS